MNLPTFWTTNKHKLEESSKILWIKLEWYTQEDLEKIKLSWNWDLREIQSMNIIEIVEQKARDVYDILWKPVIVEDTWLYLDWLNWFPWPFVKYLLEWPWLIALFKMMQSVENRNAKAITWVSMFDWKNFTTWYWELKWTIPLEPRWDKFWWSNAFEPLWTNKTFWEMTEDEKNKISMRKLALENFIKNYKK